FSRPAPRRPSPPTLFPYTTLFRSGYPFLRHGFLSALEDSGSVMPATGWQGAHRLLRSGGRAQAILPLYLKQHSWGEYVFDWQWADRKSTRLNSSHVKISYAVFCLK